jgi:hypothetical protein
VVAHSLQCQIVNPSYLTYSTTGRSSQNRAAEVVGCALQCKIVNPSYLTYSNTARSSQSPAAEVVARALQCPIVNPSYLTYRITARSSQSPAADVVARALPYQTVIPSYPNLLGHIAPHSPTAERRPRALSNTTDTPLLHHTLTYKRTVTPYYSQQREQHLRYETKL